jgi:hypothetical protein
MVWQVDAKLPEQFLLCGGLGNAAQTILRPAGKPYGPGGVRGYDVQSSAIGFRERSSETL